jgi:hypothetical protein
MVADIDFGLIADFERTRVGPHPQQPVAQQRIVVNGRYQRLVDRQRFLPNELMGSLRSVNVEYEIGWLANHFITELDGKTELDHGVPATNLECATP